MNLSDPSWLTVRGEFQERLLRSIRHLVELNTEEMRMEFTHPSESWHWGADYMGRWISAMGLLGQYTREDYGVRRSGGGADRFPKKRWLLWPLHGPSRFPGMVRDGPRPGRSAGILPDGP